jgi:hypothetical protein
LIKAPSDSPIANAVESRPACAVALKLRDINGEGPLPKAAFSKQSLAPIFRFEI